MARRTLIARPKKTVKSTRSEQYIINRKHLGDEPIFTKPLTKVEYINALNWYNYMCSASDAKEYIVDYLKNLGRVADAKKIKSVPDNLIPTTVAWICRMLSKGYKLPVESTEYANQRIVETYKYIQETKEEDSSKPLVSIQDRMRERAHDILGEIEGMIDDYIYDNVEFSLYEWLQTNNIPAAYATNIIAKLSPVLDELLEAYSGKCEQLKEGYRHYKKSDLKNLVSFYNTLIEDAERYSSNTKKVRTARKPRTVSVEKKIKNIKFQKEDATLKIVSVAPEKIIGAMELWTYNTKYKVFTRLVAVDRGGLQVKGTSITNYCENSSISRSVGRKDPTEFLRRILEGGKLVLRKVLDELKTEKPLAFRINENTILLRVVS